MYFLFYVYKEKVTLNKLPVVLLQLFPFEKLKKDHICIGFIISDTNSDLLLFARKTQTL